MKKAYDKQAIQESKGRQMSVQKGEKWGLDIYAQIAAGCNTVAYITGGLAVGICQVRMNDVQMFGKI